MCTGICRDAARYVDLQQHSVPVAGLRMGADDAGGAGDHAPEPLPLFGAVQHDFQSEPAKSGKWAGAKRRRTADGEPVAGNANGAVFHCGGPVWGLDWSPAVPAQPAGSADSSTGRAAVASSRQDASGAAEPGSSQFLAVRYAHQLTVSNAYGVDSLWPAPQLDRAQLWPAAQPSCCASRWRCTRGAGKAMSWGVRCQAQPACSCGRRSSLATTAPGAAAV